MHIRFLHIFRLRLGYSILLSDTFVPQRRPKMYVHPPSNLSDEPPPIFYNHLQLPFSLSSSLRQMLHLKHFYFFLRPMYCLQYHQNSNAILVQNYEKSGNLLPS